MSLFKYTARHPDGRVLTGDQDATSELEALRILQKQGLTVTRIQEGAAAGVTVPRSRHRHQRIRERDMLLFIRQLSTLMGSNVPLLRALDVIKNQTESDKLSAVLLRVESDIRSGATLRDALARHPKVFPNLWSHLIEAGEVSGKLPMVLEQLADHVETSSRIRNKFITAMVYPAILILVASGAVTTFLVWIIPIFERLFASFNAPLPLLTRLVIGASRVLRFYFWFITGGGVLLGVVLSRAVSTAAGRAIADRLVINLPIAGAFVQDVILARVSANLHILIKSGVNILRGLEIAARSSGNGVFEEALLRVRDDVQHGRPISASLSKHSIFPGMLVQMVMIGEESGKLEELMSRVAEYYEEQVNVFVNRLSTLLEPMILGAMGIVVGVLVVSMFLPVFKLSTIVH